MALQAGRLLLAGRACNTVAAAAASRRRMLDPIVTGADGGQANPGIKNSSDYNKRCRCHEPMVL